MQGVLDEVLQRKQAVINRAALPIPSQAANMKDNFALSQFRHQDFQAYATDAGSFFAYPIMDSFAPDAKVAGVLATNMYWRLYFSHALSTVTGSFVVVLENSFQQTLSYHLDGNEAVFLGDADHHDERYDHLMEFTDLSEYYAKHLSNAACHSYTAVPLGDFGRYTLRVYPTQETEDMFVTSKPWLYTCIVVAVSQITSILFAAFVYFVERRQCIVMKSVIHNANKAAAAERDLNEFLAHEIRNPLASAMVAHSFVTSAMADPQVRFDDDARVSIAADQKIVSSSLHFFDDFLRSMLLIYRSDANKLEVELSPTNLYKQVFEPVADILHPRNGEAVEIAVDCPRDLEVMTDSLRLQQVLLNLGKNSSKFVNTGFIHLKAAVVDGMVELCVEDSGPGIAEHMKKLLFKKYHTTLDVVTQGNGIGLSLCKNLVHLLKGEIMLDASYQSGVAESPGARFVVKLKMPPIIAPTQRETDTSADNTTIPNSGVSKGDSSNSEPAPPLLPEKLSVLFVDDDAILRKLFIRSIRNACPHWTVQGAASGEAALKLLLESNNHANGSNGDMQQDGDQIDEEQGTTRPSICRFDLLFVDQYMSTSSSSSNNSNATQRSLLGTETVATMRAAGIQSTICGLSANDMQNEFLAAGADSFTLKPLPCDKQALQVELSRITENLRQEES